VIPVLYLHGFASTPDGEKAVRLRELLAPRSIALIAPDLNVPDFRHLDFEAMVDAALESARTDPPAAIVGSSLGGALALAAIARGVKVPAVLIAPAIAVGDLWRERLPPGDPILVHHFALGAETPIHRTFFEQMSELRIDDAPPPVPVVLVMGGNDEDIPFDRVAGRWREWEGSGNLAAGSKFIEIPGGDHRLIGWLELIAGQIVTITTGEL
jgi:pimeloyl-ACP methyl ester carboxylesterase